MKDLKPSELVVASEKPYRETHIRFGRRLCENVVDRNAPRPIGFTPRQAILAFPCVDANDFLGPSPLSRNRYFAARRIPGHSLIRLYPWDHTWGDSLLRTDPPCPKSNGFGTENRLGVEAHLQHPIRPTHHPNIWHLCSIDCRSNKHRPALHKLPPPGLGSIGPEGHVMSVGVVPFFYDVWQTILLLSTVGGATPQLTEILEPSKQRVVNRPLSRVHPSDTTDSVTELRPPCQPLICSLRGLDLTGYRAGRLPHAPAPWLPLSGQNGSAGMATNRR